jgi:hypothetical protein
MLTPQAPYAPVSHSPNTSQRSSECSESRFAGPHPGGVEREEPVASPGANAAIPPFRCAQPCQPGPNFTGHGRVALPSAAR